MKLSRRSLDIVTLALITDGVTMFVGGMGFAIAWILFALPGDPPNEDLWALVIFGAGLLYLSLSILALIQFRPRNSRTWAFFIAGLALLSLGTAVWFVCMDISNFFLGPVLMVLFILISLGLNGYVILAILRAYLGSRQLEPVTANVQHE